MKTTDELIQLLKSGEYDGADLMQAWCRMKDQQKDLERLQAKYEAVCGELEVAQNELDKARMFGHNPIYNDAIKISFGDKVIWEKK